MEKIMSMLTPVSWSDLFFNFSHDHRDALYDKALTVEDFVGLDRAAEHEANLADAREFVDCLASERISEKEKEEFVIWLAQDLESRV